jgi:HK97 family phage prohead protease
METDLEVRSFGLEVRAEDEEQRIISGIGVPWDEDAKVGSLVESFERGSVDDTGALTLLLHDQKEVLGRVIHAEDTDRGRFIRARIAKTPRGDEVLALAREGLLSWSIGFVPGEAKKRADGAVVRTRVRAKEYSLVPFGAYAGAQVTSVRSEPPAQVRATNQEEGGSDMETDTVTPADLVEVRAALEDLERRFELLPGTLNAPVETDPFMQFRSIGEYVKAVAAGEEAAVRAYAGAVSGDTVLKAAWIGSLVEIIKKRRPIFETFSTGPLPAEGLSVEYAYLKSNTMQAGVQAAEGDDLLFGKVSIDTATAPVKTIGGWTSLSRQAIERANVGILDTSWEALVEQYGRASEVYARGILNTALAATGGDALAEVEADIATQDGIVAMVLNLVEHFEEVGRSLDGILVDKASFLALYSVEATDRVLQVTGAPQDKVGTLTVKTGSGEVAGLNFKLLPGAAADTLLAYDRTAIKVLEAPGAPARLQDENIVNLTKDFSLYGYLSGAVVKRAGLVKVVEEA